MIKYNKIASYNNYKMADLEDHIKKHWWKYLIGLGLAGAGGYLVYQKFFAKPKEDEKAAPGKPGSPHNVILELMNKDTGAIDKNDLGKIHSLLNEALDEAEKRYKDDQNVLSAVSELRGLLKQMNAAKSKNPEEALSSLRDTLHEWQELKNIDKNGKFNQLVSEFLHYEAPSKAYKKHFATFNIDGYNKIYNIIRELSSKDDYKAQEGKDYVAKLTQGMFIAKAMKKHFDEMKNITDNPQHIQWLEKLYTHYFDAFFHNNMNHYATITNSLMLKKDSKQS